MHIRYHFKASSLLLFLFIEIFIFQKNLIFAESKNAFRNNAFSNDSTSNNRICEERFVKINGIDQWITIKGERSKPPILFLHGGPGSPLSPYSDSIYGKWEKEFIIIQWDQRGSGRTFGINAPGELTPDYFKSNPLTLDLMTADGIELTEYLLKYLRKQKIILYGVSWGSALGVKMSIKRPDLFYAYIGTSVVVNPSEDLLYDYHKIYSKAQSKNDQESINTLNSIGLPPYDNVRNAGKLFRIIKKYEKQNLHDSSWLKLSPEYDNEKDIQHLSDGDDYSFINYIGDKRFVAKSIISTCNLLIDDLEFKIPVYIIQGEEDILTPKEITKNYFDKIRASKKEYILLPKTAHGIDRSVVEAQYKIMKNYILPFMQGNY